MSDDVKQMSDSDLLEYFGKCYEKTGALDYEEHYDEFSKWDIKYGDARFEILRRMNNGTKENE